MLRLIQVTAILSLLVVIRVHSKSVTIENEFPKKFKFGVATAAFQIEGGWNEDGKGPSIWDVGTHQYPDRIADNSNADISDDSYHKFNRDLEMLKELGVNFYRFSISWSRILPNGDISSLNKAGVKYYSDVINQLLANNIEPMITMYHYDLPEEIQKLGGLTNPLFPKYFEQYANVLYSNFGDRVKLWITFNEPVDYCNPGYGTGTIPPFINATGVGEYLCIDNTLKGHTLAYHLYKNKFYKKQEGKIGIVFSSRFCYSRTNDNDVVDRALQFNLGWLAHPLFSKSGGYPEVMIRDIASNSLREGRSWSRLPHMNEHWKYLIKGAADFFGLNYYSSRYVKLAPPKSLLENPSWENDARLEYTVDPSWKQAKSRWLYNVPEGLGDLLRWIKDEYDNVEVYVTENGWSDDGQIDDNDRITYLQEHLRSVAKAINESGCHVSGYAHWSLLDNFEWMMGYTERFGLYHVNFSTPERVRTPKKSFSEYKNIIKFKKV